MFESRYEILQRGMSRGGRKCAAISAAHLDVIRAGLGAVRQHQGQSKGGAVVEGVGVPPDVEVPLPPAALREGRDYFFGSLAASFVLSMALSIFSPAFSTGPFSGHALVASAIADKARTTMTLRKIFMLLSMSCPGTAILFNSEHPGTALRIL
jgi:hypothetical protein